jgi:hypothetical protein
MVYGCPLRHLQRFHPSRNSPHPLPSIQEVRESLGHHPCQLVVLRSRDLQRSSLLLSDIHCNAPLIYADFMQHLQQTQLEQLLDNHPDRLPQCYA